MLTNHEFVAAAMAYEGLPYVFGAEADLDPGVQPVWALDCSELVQVALADLGFSFPDGTMNQEPACIPITVDMAISTPGALLFFPGHVAISRGDGTTIEAKGRAYGVGVFPSTGRFQTAGLIPGLDYTFPEQELPDMTPQEFAAAINAEIPTTGPFAGKVCVPLINDPAYPGQPASQWGTTLYPLANAIAWTHMEQKMLRLQGK